MTFEGDFIESGATVQATEADLTPDIKELIDLGLYSLEEALAKCTVGGSKERRMIIRKPTIKMIDGANEGEKIPQIQRFEEVFTEEDLLLECLTEREVDEDEDTDEVPFEEEVVEGTVDSSDDDLEALLAALD